MRFAAIADVHGNYLALEAVIADIRALGIDTIVNLGDMASGPLDARRTMDALITLDAVHVLGNHDRYLIDRPPEKMGSWDRPAHAQLDAHHLDWLRAVPPTRVFRDQVFLCHAMPDNDEAYWLETVLPDGTVRMAALEEIEKAAAGIAQRLILCAHTHIARAVRLSDGRLIGQTLAIHYREDLERAGLGSGHHGFDFVMPDGAPCDTTVFYRQLDGLQST